MRIAVFDTHRFDREAMLHANAEFGHELTFFEPRLNAVTAKLAQGFPAICSFVNDRLNGAALEILKQGGTQLLALRCAGYNHVDLETAKRLGLVMVRVPEYSPYAVAEHAVALLLTLNRKIHRAFNRVRENNFALDGLMGFDLHGKTIGVIGTGKIGRVFAEIMHGFGCTIVAHDPYPNASWAERLDLRYVELPELYGMADVISLHLPLMPTTSHLINARAIAQMKRSVILINTGRGALIDSKDLINALKTGQIAGACLDVYEEEEGVFFQDLSGQVLQDEVLARLLTFPNVLVTSHQAFLTREALHNIATTTLANVRAFERGERLVNEVKS